ncbi:MAG: ubiquinone biosynthesis protein [Alphaproteobacteria bacterium]|nr:MAG: ubiquinone biosynthesis protein [Alphaproteobacteria bacterium]
MGTQSFNPAIPAKRDWGAALRALRQLLANRDDTVQVFRIMRALNGGNGRINYDRLLKSPEGGRLAYERAELARLFADDAWVAQFAEGSVGAAYRAFLGRTGYSADGLVDISTADGVYPRDIEHPYAWYGRRERDVHDIWHVLTGYEADEPLGEACLVAFSYAQTKGLGWALIAAGAALKSLRITGNTAFFKAVWEGYRHGRRAAWLPGEDYQRLMAEPIADARARLKIADPKRYREAQLRLRESGVAGL